MLNETVIFRATDELASAIQQRASEAGVTVSEYLRDIIASSVGVHEFVSPVCFNLAEAAFFTGEDCAHKAALAGAPLRPGNPYPDPMALLPAAAEGDRQAQRDLADVAILRALSSQPEVDPFTTLSEGLVFARLADRGDGNPDDAMRVVTMLALGSTLTSGSAARDMAGEAIARLELHADSGSILADQSADLLASCAQHESPETMRIAKDYRDRLTAETV
jgi:hypothetical protein